MDSSSLGWDGAHRNSAAVVKGLNKTSSLGVADHLSDSAGVEPQIIVIGWVLGSN